MTPCQRLFADAHGVIVLNRRSFHAPLHTAAVTSHTDERGKGDAHVRRQTLRCGPLEIHKEHPFAPGLPGKKLLDSVENLDAYAIGSLTHGEQVVAWLDRCSSGGSCRTRAG